MLGCVDTPQQRHAALRGPRRGDALGPRAQPAAAALDRLRLPALLPAADADARPRTSSCRMSEAGVGRRRPAAAHARAARLRRPVGARRPPAVAALGRRDAARGDRARARQPAAAAAGRRAHRRAGPGHRRAHRGAARPRERRRHRAGHRHPRPRAGRPRARGC